MSEGGPPAPPPCLILDLPDAIVELVLSQLTPWEFCRATGACKAFHSHARGVAAVRAARFGLTLPRPLADEPVLRMLHVVESVAGWVFEELDEDPLKETRTLGSSWSTALPVPASIFAAIATAGWSVSVGAALNGRRHGRPGPSKQTRAWSARLMMMPLTRCTTSSCFVGSPPGVIVNLTVTMATGASRCILTECWCRQRTPTTQSEPTLLNAQGGMVHMRTRVGVGADFVMYVDAVEYGPDVATERAPT